MENCCYGCGKPGIIKNKSRDGWRCAVSPNSCQGVQKKKLESLEAKYGPGVTNVSQVKEVHDKKKETWVEKYGVDNPSKAPEIQQKIKDAWPETERKRKITSLEKYGVEDYASSDEFKRRREATWLEKYGVTNPTLNEEILHQVMLSNEKSEYRTKSLILPSGKEVRYQGYEDKVILELIGAGYSEEEIVTKRGEVPKIRYEFEGKKCIYYPDIYLPKDNQLVEVKSIYTWRKYKKKNLAKIRAAKQAGFHISIAIR